MTTGISHHISPCGDLEPCPVIQFAKENIRDSSSVFELIRDSAFLKDFRETAARTTRGCLVLERPDLIRELAQRHGARDSTLRGTALAELDAMKPRFSQWLPGEEIPERHWMYRLAKQYAYSDFGAYHGLPSDAEGKVRALKTSLAAAPTAMAQSERVHAE